MGEFRLSDYSSDFLTLSLLLLIGSAFTVPWVEVSVSSLRDFVYYLILPWVVVIPFHEGLHALVARLFGARVRFGVTTFGKLVVAPYTAVETPLTARRFIAVTLAPLSLSLIALALAWLLRSDFWALVYVFNTAGMAGDFIVILALLGLSPDTEVVDRGEALVSSSGTLEPYPLWVSKALRVVLLAVLLAIIARARVEVVVENSP
ncbi:DUF3267 domain-containing protein [Thermococcus nautili]|uniref:M50 metallopeptidase n=1 Tax=Thermococcus nautili TaxID=195522 RepID=W8P4T2_9EURY|nr:DUF3267 domain-containing protein [Thermococcus nautili]AHL23821.1 M50 metallopeptidase [Thermococcus nautili]